MASDSFDKLRSRRLRLVDAHRENGFEEGVRSLLTDLYPDNAHFIYELLQNAEDARATTVDFNLSKEQLVVSHDGARSFTLRDIEAITHIGTSPKKDDETQIGKFGVGFKAVFAYTDHPEVHSGEYAFVIKDMFVPKKVTAKPPGGKTKFVFPFDNPKKPPSVAYEEIARGLQSLESTTVLFLTRIQTISYQLADGETGSVSRSDEGDSRITITKLTGDERQCDSWLRIVGKAPEPHDQMEVAVAFRLEQRPTASEQPAASDQFGIRPLAKGQGQTCIYFPAAKEFSGLRFHVHAPFASTVARDSVRDTPENNELVEALGLLIVEELPKLRDDGLLDEGLLASLPNADDSLGHLFVTIRKQIYAAFQKQPLTPVYGGGENAPADDLYLSPPEFRRWLEQADLAQLLAMQGAASGQSNSRWVAERSGDAGRFLRGLDIAEFGWEELEQCFWDVEYEFKEFQSDDAEPEGESMLAWMAWIASKKEKPLKRFYEMLGYGKLEDHLSEFDALPLIRTINGDDTSHVAGAGIFLPVDRDDVGPDRVPASLSYFDDEQPSKSRSHLEAFFTCAGVRRWDVKAKVEEILAGYPHTSSSANKKENVERRFDLQQHFCDVREFIKCSDSGAASGIFSERRVLLAERADGREFLRHPSQIVIDEPYEETHLASLYADKFRLSPKYKNRVEGIVGFAKALGAPHGMGLSGANCRVNEEFKARWMLAGKRTSYQHSKDWDLPELDQILELRDKVLLKSLWTLVCDEDQEKAEAYYQLNRSAGGHTFSSQVAQRLRSTAWVLDRGGLLCKPESMTEADLPDGWPRPGPGSLAIAVGFGRLAKEQDAEQVERRKKAESIGMVPELADALAEYSAEEQVELAQEMRQRKERSAFPRADSEDPKWRAEIVGQDALVAPKHASEKRQRTVATHAAREAKDKAKKYLEDLYTDDHGVMFCQGCDGPEPMPFKGNDDRWYFEAVAYLPKRTHLHHQNYLALCPLCAAKYQHARKISDEALVSELQSLTVPPPGAEHSVLLIQLAGRQVELKFTAKHLADLQAVIKAAGGERS